MLCFVLGASEGAEPVRIRRVILRLAVGWRPPDVHPSGACLHLGASILYQPDNAAEGDTTPGRRLFRCTWGTFRSWGWNALALGWSEGVPGPLLALAHMKPASSRAMATMTTLAWLPSCDESSVALDSA